MKDLTPRKIVEYLDEYIVGQQNAKRSCLLYTSDAADD